MSELYHLLPPTHVPHVEGGAHWILHLGAQGIPGPCPQLVGLGLGHVSPLLCIIQLVLGLAILSQVGASLLLLGVYTGPWFPFGNNKWSFWSPPHPQKELASPVLLLYLPPASLSTRTHSRRRKWKLYQEVPECQPAHQRQPPDLGRGKHIGLGTTWSSPF